MANEIEIPLKLSGVQSLKAELRSLKAAIAEASDPEQMAALAARAGEVADRIKDANDAVNVFASGSKFEQISNSFGGIRDSLMSLDFEEASEKAKVFSKSLGGLNAADISKGLKGLTSTVTTMGGAFVKLGMQLLVNPIFLLAAVITAIVVAVVAFLKKIGVLDKIFNAINAALKPLIDGFKQLTEWLGLSTAASDDAAEKVKANNEKIVASSKERAEAQSKSIDQEIQLAQSLGKETTDLEIEKTKVTERESKKRLKQTQKDLKELGDKVGTLAEQERARLKKQLKEENALIRQAQVDRKVILNKAAKEDADEAKEKEAKDAEDAKKRAEDAAKAYREGRTAIQKEIAAANKLVVDSGKTQQQKEIDDVKAKYDALIKEAKKYKQDVTALKAAEQLEIDAINKAVADAELERQKNLAKQLADFRNEELDRAEAIQEQAYQSGLTARQKEIEERTYYYDNLIAEANRYGVDTKIFEEQRRKELADINKKFDDQEKQVALEKIAQEQAIRDAKIEIASSVAQGLGAIGEAFIKDQEKLEKFNKAQALIQIGIDTAKAISSLVAMSQANPLNSVTAGAAGLAQYAAGIVQIVTNIAKAKSILMNPTNTSAASAGGGGGTSSSASGGSSVPSFVPGNLFGQGNAANNVTAPTGMEQGQNITVTAVVSETEITATQNKVNKIMKNSVL
jgi:hypothetical protein